MASQEEWRRKNARQRLRTRLDPGFIRAEVEKIKPIEEWDWEELERGYPRGLKGRFGKRPVWADLLVTDDEVQRRLRKLTAAKLRGGSRDAIGVVMNLMMDDSVDLDGKPSTPAAVRLKAAELIIEHTIGKPTQHVDVDAGDNLSNLLASCMVNDDGEDAHPVIIPGELLDEDEEED